MPRIKFNEIEREYRKLLVSVGWFDLESLRKHFLTLYPRMTSAELRVLSKTASVKILKDLSNPKGILATEGTSERNRRYILRDKSKLLPMPSVKSGVDLNKMLTGIPGAINEAIITIDGERWRLIREKEKKEQDSASLN